MIDGLCRAYGKLPSEVLAEPADLLLPMLAILAIAEPEDNG